VDGGLSEPVLEADAWHDGDDPSVDIAKDADQRF
jgi:hypothetical protein